MEHKEMDLDPEDWNAMRELGHKMVNDMIHHLQSVREQKAWQPIPATTKARLQGAIPREPEGAEKAYQDFLELVLPYPLGNTHPRFWGWVIGTGTPLGMFADMLASGMNAQLFGAQHSAVLVEEQVLEWCKEMLGFPATGSGLFVSGGTMANLIGVAVARNSMASFDVMKDGLGSAPSRLTFYGSMETHSSIGKSAMLLGLGTDAFRKIPVNERFEVDIEALQRVIAADRAAGHQPFCVVGNAGTVNTGAFDDLTALADLCKKEQLWFHVDGAFGAMAAIAPDLRHHVRGMERAHSLAFDLHKWMYMPYEVGCVLIRNPELHWKAFNSSAAYLSHAPRGVASGGRWFSELGIQLSRGFRALKVWMSLKEHGIHRYAELVQQNVEQAHYLESLILAEPDLELLAPVALNVVCFRFRQSGCPEADLNQLNQELLMRLHESGVAVPSSTTLNGKFAIRVANTNHRTRREDFDILIAKVLEIGHQCASETKPILTAES